MDMIWSKLREIVKDREAWRASVHGVMKSWTRLSSWTTTLLRWYWDYAKGFSGGSDGKESACKAQDTDSIPGSGRSPEKWMATCSSVLAWRIPWTEEPGRLHSMGSQRAGHDQATVTFTFKTVKAVFSLTVVSLLKLNLASLDWQVFIKVSRVQ